MSKFEILLVLLQMFGPVIKEAWPLILQLFGVLEKAPQPQFANLLGRARGRQDRVDDAQKAEVYRLAGEHGISKEEIDAAVAPAKKEAAPVTEDTPNPRVARRLRS